MVQASLPLFGLLIIMVGLMIWNAAFYGDDTVGEEFGDIEEPTGFLSTIEFLTDTVVAIAKTVWAFMTVPGSEHLPESIQVPVRIVFGLVFALALVAALISLL